jgi:hypothetical protein
MPKYKEKPQFSLPSPRRGRRQLAPEPAQLKDAETPWATKGGSVGLRRRGGQTVEWLRQPMKHFSRPAWPYR